MAWRTALPRWLAILLVVLLALGGCGGGGGGGNSTPVAPYLPFPVSAASKEDTNVAVVVVESGPQANVNIPYVSVKVCVPGSSTNCQTIDHVMVDTGSTGLRLFASQVRLALPGQQVGSNTQISECAQFINTLAWGSVKLADVAISGERANNIPIQLMDASGYPAGFNIACSSSPLLATTNNAAKNWRALSANGILGVGLFTSDGQTYFKCSAPNVNTCRLVGSNAPTELQQVRNPVAHFATNNNGVVLQLPAIPANASGATGAYGYLTFGINTQGNNQLATAKVLQVNSAGQFTTIYQGTSLPSSIMDSGSNGLYFDDANLSTPACASAPTGFYCPSSTRKLSASIQLDSVLQTMTTIEFSVANADQLFSPGGVTSGNYVFNNLGGRYGGQAFDWGLPFFFGRSVFTAIDGQRVVRAGAADLIGPFHAFTN